MAGKSASVFPLLTTSSFMSIVGVEQTVGRGRGSRACAVCIAGEKSTKERTRTAVEIIQKRDSCFITIPALIQRLGLDCKPKARQLVRLRPSRPAQRRRMLSGRVESHNTKPGRASRSPASEQQSSPQSGDCSNWLKERF